MRKCALLPFLFLLMAVPAAAQETVYSWQSPGGTVVETGGQLEHINQNGHDKRNIKCGPYYTFVLNGDYRYADAGYNVDECSYMRLTLDGGDTFRAGDEIEVTAMRNNTADRPASICFLFRRPDGHDAALLDDNTWANLGQGHDDSFSGGTSAGAKSADGRATASAFSPSTHTFTVPAGADGARYVRLTRNATGNMLYVLKLTVRRPAPTAVGTPQANSPASRATEKRMAGGRLVIISHGRAYDAAGRRLGQ